MKYDLSKEAKEHLHNKASVDEVFYLQHALMVRYIEMGGLPAFEQIDLNNKDSQGLLKKITYNTIEELCEAYEILKDIARILTTKVYTQHTNEIEEKILAFNEELADIMHFYIELLILADVSPYDIDDEKDRLIRENSLTNVTTGDQFDTWLGIAMHSLITEDRAPFYKAVSFPVIESDYTYHQFACRYVSVEYFETVGLYMFNLIQSLTLCMNQLKKRAWRVNGGDTDMERFKDSLVKSFLQFMKLMRITDINARTLFLSYYRKNKINHRRIDEKY